MWVEWNLIEERWKHHPFKQAHPAEHCHPKTWSLHRGTGKSKECTLPLQETAHYSLKRREFLTSRGYNVWGSTLTQPWGEINTPAGPRKCARVRSLLPTCKHVRLKACTHSCVSSVTHTYIPPKKTGWPQHVLITWSCPVSSTKTKVSQTDLKVRPIWEYRFCSTIFLKPIAFSQLLHPHPFPMRGLRS